MSSNFSFENDDRFQAMKLLREWSSWMVTIEGVLVAFLAHAIGSESFRLNRSYVMWATTLFCASIAMAAWVLGSLPSIAQRLRRNPGTLLGGFGFLDLPLLRYIPLSALTFLQHLFFFTALVPLVLAFFIPDTTVHVGGFSSFIRITRSETPIMSNEVAALLGAAMGGIIGIVGTVVTQAWNGRWRREDRERARGISIQQAQLTYYSEAIYYSFKLSVSATTESLTDKDVRQHLSQVQRYLALLEAYVPRSEVGEIARIAGLIDAAIIADAMKQPAAATSAAALTATVALKQSFTKVKPVEDAA